MEGVAYEIHVEAARIARAAADAAEERDPTDRASLSDRWGQRTRPPRSPRTWPTQPRAPSLFEELAEAYAEAARGLLVGGADLLMVETVSTSSTPRRPYSRSRAFSMS